MPLTGLFSGNCSADTGAAVPIEVLRHCCNAGYARTSCPRAAMIESDSAQFLVRSDDGTVIEVAWAIEKNHHPVAVGTLQVSAAEHPPEETLQHQARAFAMNYTRQKGRS
jgi:hypothetical protein